MKKILYFISAALLVLATGCTENELLPPKGPDYPVDENEVPFGAGEGAFNTGEKSGKGVSTRTIYEVAPNATFETYTELIVSWIENDPIRIYSPEAPQGYQTADYKITTEVIPGEGEYGKSGFLVKMGKNGIHWGTAEKQRFFAFYPGNDTYLPDPKNNLKTSGVFTHTIAVAQEKGVEVSYDSQTGELKHDLSGDWKIISPDMTFCNMVADTFCVPNTTDAVQLQFRPLVTVLDVVVTGPETGSYNILGVSIKSEKQDIVGTYTYDFTKEKGQRITFNDSKDEANKTAYIDCMHDGTPLKLGQGQNLNIKFFLLPRDINAQDLSIEVLCEGGYVLKKSLKKDVMLKAGRVIKIRTPKIQIGETNNWMSMIDDNVYFASQLSLPGAKHAYSYRAINSSNSGISSDTPEIIGFGNVNTKMMSFFQTKNIKDQFNSGVRAFDIKVTTVNDYAEIYAAGKNTGIRLSAFLNELSGYLNPNGQVPTEAAVVTINYVSDAHNPSEWLEILLGQQGVQEMTNAANRLKKVTSEVTMGEMRGKIGIMVFYPETTNRAASTKYTGIIQNYSTSVQDYQGSHIDAGNGLQLGQTGMLYYQNLYQVNNPDIYDSSIDGVRKNVGLCPHYILKENYDNSEVSLDLIDTKKDLIARLLAHSQASNASKTDLFMNDCAGFCVVDNNESTGWRNYAKFEYKWLFGYYWDEIKSYNNIRDPNNLPEPVQPQPENPKSGDTYLGENGGNPSLGQGGNTALFAEHINPALQDMIYSVVEKGRAPLGIVYMNFAGVRTLTVGERPYNVNGIDLPSMIMSNNFKFALKKKESTPSQQ